MPKYRFKPHEIEATQFDGNNWLEMTNFCGTRTVDNHTMLNFNPIGSYLIPFLTTSKAKAELYVQELRQHIYIEIGDWIIKRGEGDFYRINNDTFGKFLEPIEERDGVLSE